MSLNYTTAFSFVITWYLTWIAFSLLGLPLGSIVFRKFSDRGYPFYKILGLGLCGYLNFTLSTLKLLPFSWLTTVVVFVSLLSLNLLLKKRTRKYFPSIKVVIRYEFFFLLLLLLWSYIKGHEPSIHSLEKYMDFGFINSILNSKFMPPQDHWYASTAKDFFSINYYYFGHFITAYLIKITSIPPSVGYNLMLSSIFAIAVSLSFSLGYNIYLFWNQKDKKKHFRTAVVAGFLAAYLTNLAGNLHTIYLFTKGYPPENPVPFWEILSNFNPKNYWYPNATRFIPFTIHEFPSYSYVVSDLHGHVLDIPFVLSLMAFFTTFLVNSKTNLHKLNHILIALFLAIAYMTNSTDFLVYAGLLFFVLVIKYQKIQPIVKRLLLMIVFALFLTLPFSLNFHPFANSIGVNCAPEFLVKIQKFGPFVFEQNRCQTTPFWMLFVLWGFFWINFLAFLKLLFGKRKQSTTIKSKFSYFIFFVFVYSILLTLFSEFFYFKDIYPAHFRANTMFKLGYQAYILMSVTSAIILVSIYKNVALNKTKLVYLIIVAPMLFLVSIYPLFSIPSYFGNQGFKSLDGAVWVKEQYPEIYTIINRLNQLKKTFSTPPTIVEAHGESYTDYNLVSSYTGLPTIIGWPIHEWLWRGSYNIVAPRAKEVEFIYAATESELPQVKKILQKYRVKYVLVTVFERSKYPSTNIEKFYKIGKLIFSENNNLIFSIND